MVSDLKSFSFFDTFNKGEVDDDIDFTYDEDTEVEQSCAASLNGEMWVLGGYYEQRQVNISKAATIIR